MGGKSFENQLLFEERLTVKKTCLPLFSVMLALVKSQMLPSPAKKIPYLWPEIFSKIVAWTYFSKCYNILN